MKLTTRGRYALRIMVDVAMHSDGEYVPLSEISQRQQLSQKYLEQITASLRTSGLLLGTRGVRGGYILTRVEAEYTVGDILRVSEGYFVTADPEEQQGGETPGYTPSADQLFWKTLDRLVNAYADSVTLADLVDFEAGNQTLDEVEARIDRLLQPFNDQPDDADRLVQSAREGAIP